MLVRTLSGLPPSDRVTLGILAVVAGTYSVALPGRGDLLGLWALHAGLLVGFAGFALLLARREPSRLAIAARAIATLLVIFGLYFSLSTVFRVIPWNADPALARADALLFFGRSPALLADAALTHGRLEFTSFVYSCYLPYLYLSIFLGLLGRPPGERDEFLTGFALTYAISYLGYLFVPARGPIVEHAAEFRSAVESGFFHDLVVRSIESGGGPHGAFPSLHVGASAFACLFDLRHNRLRGLTYLPLVVLIAVATIFVKYHYVVDLIAGIAIAAFASLIAPRWTAAWRARRSAAGPGAGRPMVDAAADSAGPTVKPADPPATPSAAEGGRP
jgi:membrane-associated phospholipid phosphatase